MNCLSALNSSPFEFSQKSSSGQNRPFCRMLKANNQEKLMRKYSRSVSAVLCCGLACLVTSSLAQAKPADKTESPSKLAQTDINFTFINNLDSPVYINIPEGKEHCLSDTDNKGKFKLRVAAKSSASKILHGSTASDCETNGSHFTLYFNAGTYYNGSSGVEIGRLEGIYGSAWYRSGSYEGNQGTVKFTLKKADTNSAYTLENQDSANDCSTGNCSFTIGCEGASGGNECIGKDPSNPDG